MGTSTEKALEDLYTDRTLPDACQQHVLVLEGRARCGNLVKNIEVDACQVAAVFPNSPDSVFQVKERNLVGGDVRDSSDLGAKELGLRSSTASGDAASFGAFQQRGNDTLVKGFDATVLLCADTRLRLNDCPQLKDIVLNLLDVDAA